MAGCGCDLSAEGKSTMNGFALSFWAKIRLRYDCGSLPKNRKKCFPYSKELSGKRKEDARMPCGNVNGKPLTNKENEEYQQQETTPPSQNPARRGPRQLEQQEEVQQQAEALALKLARTYEELTRLLERNPGVKRQITEGEAKEDKVYQKLKQRLKLADMAPRCRWVRQDGTSCRSPQMKQHIYCFAHRQMAEARTLMLMLPAPEDANAIQVGLMRIQKALLEDTISTKKAGLLLYSMQLALTNVGQTTFGQAKDEEMVRETVSEEDAISQTQGTFTTEGTEDTEEEKGLPRMDADERGLQRKVSSRDQQSAISQNRNKTQNQNQNQKLFTTEGTEDTEKNQGLPLMSTDDTDFGNTGRKDSGEDVEFVPVPGGYGFERVRLRMEPELGGQRRPPQDMYREENREIGAAADREIGAISSLRDERLQFAPLTQDSSPRLGPRKPNESLDADTGAGSVLQTEPYANLG